MNTPQIILCPGQGAQAVSMGKGWFDTLPEARATFEAADRHLGNRLGMLGQTAQADGQIQHQHLHAPAQIRYLRQQADQHSQRQHG